MGFKEPGKAIDCLRAAVANKVAICPGGGHPPCDGCPFAEDYSKFRGMCVADPALGQDLDELAALKDQVRPSNSISTAQPSMRCFPHRPTSAPITNA